MTITRRFQATAEFGAGMAAIEWDSINAGFEVSASKAKSGGFAFKAYSQTDYGRKAITASAQARLGFFFLHSAISLGSPRIVALKSGATYLVSIYADTGGTTISARIGGTGSSTGTQVAQAAGLGATETWTHCGLDVKIAVSGWVKFYVDGSLVLSFEGDTTAAGATFDTVEAGLNQTTTAWNATGTNGAYYDDFVCDDTAGEATPAAPSDRRFSYHPASGNGASSQWTGSDGNSTDNYLLVDDLPHDGDTTHVLATSSGLRDLYDTSTFTLSAGYAVAAVIPVAIARKTDAGIATTLKLLAKNGGDESLSAELSPGISHGLLWVRNTAQPDATAWSEAGVNAVGYGVESAGVYA